MISFRLNGKEVSVDLPGDMPLLWALREYLKLTGTKFGCGAGQCGACTVHVDGSAVRSCSKKLSSVEGADVVTIEGLAGKEPHPLQKYWIEKQVPQCGYCQSGVIMHAADFLKKNPNPSDADITKGMTPVLCRCMTYPRIQEAVRAAADEMGGASGSRSTAVNASSTGAESVIFGQPDTAVDKGIKRIGNLWFDMDDRGITTINITKSEMGQHVGTALAQILAEELEVDWKDVRICHVDTAPQWGPMITGGSWSVHTSFNDLSRAGAAGRIALISAGADLLGLPADQCYAEKSRVIHNGSNRSVSYADIVRKGTVSIMTDEAELAKITLKSPSDYKLINQSLPALDLPAKTDGSAIYGIDVFRPNMAYGRLVTPPVRFGATVTRIDDTGARKVPGFIKAVALDDPTDSVSGFVVCAGETYYAADQAAAKLTVEWDKGPNQTVDSAVLAKAAEDLINTPKRWGHWVKDGDAPKALNGASKKHSAAYTTCTNLHAPMEPANAIVELKDGIWHAFTGNQNQISAVPLMAKALGVDESKVVIHQRFLGGGFGKRLDSEFIVVAALAAKAMNRPVKIIYTREQDMQFDFPRSASLQVMHGALDQNGRISAITHDVVAGWPTARVLPDLLTETVDKKSSVDSFAVAGADFWYSVPHHQVRAIQHDLAQKAVPPGYLRAVGPGFTAFAVESFMDEMADLAGVDPVTFRLNMLDAKGKQAGEAPNSVGGALRQAEVLKQVVAKSGYGKTTLAENYALGLACSFGQERTMPTWVACVAEVSVDPKKGSFQVNKLTLAADVGIIINRDNTLTQMQSALLWGVSLATKEFGSVSNGAIDQKMFNKYKPLRMADIPELDIHLVENEHFPVGSGEPATTVVAPAIANAIAKAVGARIRDLPITAEKIKQALTQS